MVKSSYESLRPTLPIDKTFLVLGALAVMLGACGGTPPPPSRGVIESSVGSWHFRRYQQVLDVEVWVRDNAAIAHTASYARDAAEKEGRLDCDDVVSAFVTRFTHDRGVVRAVVVFARRLAQEGGYTVDERNVGGSRVFSVSGNGEAWALWAAKGHVVKVGGRGLEGVPKKLIEAYARRYPSRVPAGALEGPLPPEDVVTPEGKGKVDKGKDGGKGGKGDKSKGDKSKGDKGKGDKGKGDGDDSPDDDDSGSPTPDWDEYETDES